MLKSGRKEENREGRLNEISLVPDANAKLCQKYENTEGNKTICAKVRTTQAKAVPEKKEENWEKTTAKPILCWRIVYVF